MTPEEAMQFVGRRVRRVLGNEYYVVAGARPCPAPRRTSSLAPLLTFEFKVGDGWYLLDDFRKTWVFLEDQIVP